MRNYVVIIISPEVEQAATVADHIYSATVKCKDEDGLPRTVAEVIRLAQADMAADTSFDPEDFVATHVFYRGHCVWDKNDATQ